jgi:LPXTG-site transpeptidase (sortase) family protein
LRDIAVFLFLVLFGLVAWTTGVFSAASGQPPPQVQQEPEQLAAGASSPQAASSTPALNLPLDDDARLWPSASQAAPAPERLSPDLPVDHPLETDPLKYTRNQAQKAEKVRRVIIPSLKVDAKVWFVPYNGETWNIATLGKDVAWLGDIAGESSGQNIVLAGHFSVEFGADGPFRYLSRLAPGARVIVYTDQKIYTYEVRELAIIGNTDDYVVAPTVEPQLTLLTCETWDEETEKFLRRRVVFADLVREEFLDPVGVD